MWSQPSRTVLNLVLLAVALLVAVTLLRRRSAEQRGTAIPGPKRKNLLSGYSSVLHSDERSKYIIAWQKEYGNVLRVPTAFGGSWIIFLDVKAIHYMLSTNAYNFQRPEGGRRMFRWALGGGILASEGDDHKRLRKTMNPGFSAASIRYFTSLFLEIAQRAKNHWLEQMASDGEDKITVNVASWLNSISFDSMGEAGFAHSFNAVDGSKPLVAELFKAFDGGSLSTLFRRLVLVFLREAPVFRWLPIGNLLVDRTRNAMTEIAREVMSDEGAKAEAQGGRMSLMASILKEESLLSEDEVVAQMNTLIFAAYQTTSAALTWCFHELSVHPVIQAKLRRELQRFPSVTAQQIEAELPYLDAIVKECLRLHPTIPASRRAAMSADRIPLSTPLRTHDGQYVNNIDLPAGVEVVIPIEPINRWPAIWGPDADEFRPERWLEPLPATAEEVKGWNHLLTFLDGPKNCVGRNFAVAEIKAVLATFFRDFVIDPWKDGTDVKPELAFFVQARNEGVKGLMLRVRKAEVD